MTGLADPQGGQVPSLQPRQAVAGNTVLEEGGLQIAFCEFRGSWIVEMKASELNMEEMKAAERLLITADIFTAGTGHWINPEQTL